MRRWGCDDVGMWDVALLSVPTTGQTLLHSPQHHLWVLRGVPLLSLPPPVGATCTPLARRSSLSLSPPSLSPAHAASNGLTLGAAPWEPTFPCLATSPAPSIPPGVGNQAMTFPGVSQRRCPARPPAAHVYFCSRKAQARSPPPCARSPQTGVTSKRRDLLSTIH